MVNYHLKNLILEVVDRQLADNDPECTQQTLKRLMKEGCSRQRAIEMIGGVIAEEIYRLSKNKEIFNEERFAAGLAKLSDNE
ncbi:hypothetical protein [Sporolactobacillus pectinivorans]|uniref:hypothetical protein n=1 Tax=Sporolactobacillus pectinivorans TaxID=1591408 RepID=UPI000C26118C|nr:hypothetical protein [Sporolactobacillus pectinivorans]